MLLLRSKDRTRLLSHLCWIYQYILVMPIFGLVLLKNTAPFQFPEEAPLGNQFMSYNKPFDHSRPPFFIFLCHHRRLRRKANKTYCRDHGCSFPTTDGVLLKTHQSTNVPTAFIWSRVWATFHVENETLQQTRADWSTRRNQLWGNVLRSDAYQLTINDNSSDVISHRKTPKIKKCPCCVSVKLAPTKHSHFYYVSVPTHEERGEGREREGETQWERATERERCKPHFPDKARVFLGRSCAELTGVSQWWNRNWHFHFHWPNTNSTGKVQSRPLCSPFLRETPTFCHLFKRLLNLGTRRCSIERRDS